jgi:hypothetical protein
MAFARVDFHRSGDVFLDKARPSCDIQHGLVERYDVVRAKDLNQAKLAGVFTYRGPKRGCTIPLGRCKHRKAL